MKSVDKKTINRLTAIVRRHLWFLQDADRQDIAGDVLMTFSRKHVDRKPPDDLDKWFTGAVRHRRVQWFREQGRRLWRVLADLRPGLASGGDEGSTTQEPIAPVDGHAAWEVILDDLSAHLTPEEIRDVQDMAAGETHVDLAMRAGLSKYDVARRWKKTKEKLRRLLGSGD